MQEQVQFLQAFAKIAAKGNCMLLEPYLEKKKDASGNISEIQHDGFIIHEGELLRLQYTSSKIKPAIAIRETQHDIRADGTTYKNARTDRCAVYETAIVTGVNYPATNYPLIQTNAQLAAKLQEYTAVNSELAKKLTVMSTDSLTRTALDNQKEDVRICCRKGCVQLNGAEEYTINVYRHSATNITQEQILPDLRRYVRYWDSSAKAWTAFFPVTDNLHIDVKVSKGSTVYVRHGFIPEGVQLVLLRKKKRSRKRRSGGTTGTNPAWKGKSGLRQPKNQYVHYKGVILSTSSPNSWYVPKCIGVTDKEDNNLIGKELGSICEGLIQVCGGTVAEVAAGNGLYKVIGTRVKASKKGAKEKTQACCYAKIGLQFAAAGRTFKSAGGEMARMKYRLWFEQRDVYKNGVKIDKQTVVRRGFSVD